MQLEIKKHNFELRYKSDIGNHFKKIKYYDLLATKLSKKDIKNSKKNLFFIQDQL